MGGGGYGGGGGGGGGGSMGGGGGALDHQFTLGTGLQSGQVQPVIQSNFHT